MPKMRKAVDELSATLLTLQGDGDYAGVQKLVGELGVVRPQLAEDLARLKRSNIPVDVTFTQGKSVLRLN
jgi:predicted DNA-binding transcriptional regulator YafY